MERRTFLKNSATLAFAASLPGLLRANDTPAAASANTKINLALIGCGGRGTLLLDLLLDMPDIEISYLCDVDKTRFQVAGSLMQSKRGHIAKRVTDMREVFADKSVDAVLIATPHHWHGLAAIWACQAGKDVYVEKPLALTLREGRLVVEAARKYQRVVQVGTQTESMPFFKNSLDFARSGKLGRLRMVKTQVLERPPAIAFPKPGRSIPVPATLDWNMFCGPSEVEPYGPGQWFEESWNFGLGRLLDRGVHHLSMIRHYLDLKAPISVYSIGGRRKPETDPQQTCPDTLHAIIECQDQEIIFEGGFWAPYYQTPFHAFSKKEGTPDWLRANKVELYGTEAMLVAARHAGGWQAFNRGTTPIAGGTALKDDTAHLRNFFDCMRSRARPNSDVEFGHQATLLAHLMAASHRAGNIKVTFDPATETITNSAVANQFLTRTSRGEFKIPETV